MKILVLCVINSSRHRKCFVRGFNALFHCFEQVIIFNYSSKCSVEWNNKHLMTGPKGNSEFCFPETLNVPRGEAEGNIEVEGKQNSLFPEGSVIKCFVIPPNSK